MPLIPEKIIGVRLSDWDDSSDHKVVVHEKPMYEYSMSNDELDLQVGKFCMLKDAPCQIRRIYHHAAGKMGHTKHTVHGISLLDGTPQEDLIGPGQAPLVPTIIETMTMEDYDFDHESTLPPIFSWEDDEYTPENDENSVLTLVLSRNQGGENEVQTKTIWSIRKFRYEWKRNCNPTLYQYFLREQEKVTRREENKKSFYSFRATARSCGTLSKMEVPEIMDSIFWYTCGHPQYRRDYTV